ncbi:MAG: hypothetical protein O2816_13570 [Planctomycetota bacterium]|nr:hypothetical protein [Planctomycetota bacterium]
MNQLSLKARSIVQNNTSCTGEVNAASGANACIQVGPLATFVKIEAGAAGTLTVTDINSPPDVAHFSAEVRVDGAYVATFAGTQTGQGTKPVNESEVQYLCLRPGSHVLDARLTATASVGRLGTCTSNFQSLATSGLTITLTDMGPGLAVGTPYCGPAVANSTGLETLLFAYSATNPAGA